MSCEAWESEPAHVTIELGAFVDDAGQRVGPWRYFIDVVYQDGTRIGMADRDTATEAMQDAEELAEDFGDIPIIDMVGGGTLQ